MAEKPKPKLTFGAVIVGLVVVVAVVLVFFLYDAFTQAGRGTGPFAVLHDYWWGGIPFVLFVLGLAWVMSKLNLW